MIEEEFRVKRILQFSCLAGVVKENRCWNLNSINHPSCNVFICRQEDLLVRYAEQKPKRRMTGSTKNFQRFHITGTSSRYYHEHRSCGSFILSHWRHIVQNRFYYAKRWTSRWWYCFGEGAIIFSEICSRKKISSIHSMTNNTSSYRAQPTVTGTRSDQHTRPAPFAIEKYSKLIEI